MYPFRKGYSWSGQTLPASPTSWMSSASSATSPRMGAAFRKQWLTGDAFQDPVSLCQEKLRCRDRDPSGRVLRGASKVEVRYRHYPRKRRKASSYLGLRKGLVWRGADRRQADEHDKEDVQRLTQTHLEQINSNVLFREVAAFLTSIQYMHLVPQLLRYPDAFPGQDMPGDPFGKRFLENLAKTSDKTRSSRLKKIESALHDVVPSSKSSPSSRTKPAPLILRPSILTGGQKPESNERTSSLMARFV